jgi:ABC-type polysaccharide/polyol phosphate transport system ATPase subunit
MSTPAVVFDGVWKKFRRGERHDSLRDLVPSLVKRAFSGSKTGELAEKEFWAVEDVSFDVGPGEALGIIGPNGAGKSTTLKLLTRILRPNRGACQVRGRVGALIEVAAGFHPDLTGRENVFLQGSIMGMKRAEVIHRLDEIIEFAGVTDFIDTQVKRYSSGMNARLGFAIAAHLDPDVLIIDEVLSVGDLAFQQRCVERMFGFKRQGVAIVFVSHNLQAVAGLCERTLFLKRTTQFLGPTAEAISRYVNSLTMKERTATHPVSVEVSLTSLESGRQEDVIKPGQRLRMRASFLPSCDVGEFLVSFIVKRSTDELVVYHGQFPCAELGYTGLRAGELLVVDFDFVANITRGQYHVDTLLFELSSQSRLAWLSPAALLTVEERRTWRGVADLAVRARATSPAPSSPVQS